MPAPPRTRVPAPHKAAGAGLARKLGPLPVWGWMLVVVGGVGVGLYLRHRVSGSSAVQPQPQSGVGAPADQSSFGSVGGSQQPAGSGLPPDLESLILAQESGQQTLVQAFQTSNAALVSLASGAQAQAQGAYGQSFDFAQSVFGSALDFATRASAQPSVPQIVYTAPAQAITPMVTSAQPAPAAHAAPAPFAAAAPAPVPHQVFSAPSAPAAIQQFAAANPTFAAKRQAGGHGPQA